MIVCLKPQFIPARVVAIATAGNLTPTYPFPDPQIPGGYVPKYGDDFDFGIGAVPLRPHDVGQTAAVLKPKMQKLVDIFAGASASSKGMAQRLFTEFLNKQPTQAYFDDPDLNKAADAHSQVKDFCSAALNAPNSPYKVPGKTRIHQVLKAANWDIMKASVALNLGPPAFNIGSWLVKHTGIRSGDFSNALAVMANGIQHVYVIATNYYYDKSANQYCITLKFLMYDVFGLDEEDLNKFGAEKDGVFHTNAGIGITAWWQLQHQQSYAPLVTRITLENTYQAPAI